jgi:O-methyltransferase
MITPQLHLDNETKQKISHAYASIRNQPPWCHPKSTDIAHHRVLPHATYSPWLLDVSFQNIYDQIKEHTLVDIYRCYELWTIGQELGDIPGDYLEVGVWKGGTGALLASSIQNLHGKHCFLADTFQGVVKAGDADTVYAGGEHSDTSPEIVTNLLKGLGLSNFSLLEGTFPDQTGSQINGPLALVHCDVDVYSSAKAVVEWALPKLSRGGMIIFDDYGFSGCEGVTRLVNQVRNNSELLFIHNLNGHAMLIKR